MPLDKVYAYHLVRVLRVAMPLFVVLLLVFIFRNYSDRAPDQPLAEETGSRLVEELSDLTEELSYLQFEGERMVLNVQARTNLGFRDGRNLLSDVSVTVYGEEEGEPERRIHSDRCGVVQETGDMDCDGNVEIQLDRLTVGRTSALRYVHASRTITTLDRAEIVRPDRFSIRADRMIVMMTEDEFRLLGNVHVQTADGATFETDRARFFRRDGRVVVDGGLRVVSERGELRSAGGEADLDPETFSPYRVRVLEGVSAQSLDSDNPSSLVAGELEIDLESGELQGMWASGEVALGSGAGSERRTLYGDSVDASFDLEGTLEAVEARGNARMLFPSGELLESPVIRNEIPDLVTTLGDSVLDLGDFRIEGSDFRIERGTSVRFRAESDALIRLPSGFTRGQRTEAEFDPDTNMLLALTQTGEVEFELSGKAGSAERAQLQAGGDRIVLDGRPRITSASVRIDATEIVLDQRDQSFRATGSVRTVSEGDPPALVRSEVAEGGEEQVRFSGAVELWRGNTYVSAATIDIDQQSNGFVADSNVVSTLDDARIWSDRLEFSDVDGVVHYLGNVRVETEEMEMTAQDLLVTLADGQPDRIVGNGDVRLSSSDLDGRGDAAVYVRSTETLVLTGQNAEVSDSDTGVVRGHRFDIDVANNIVTVTSGSGQRVVSRRVLEPE